MKVILFAPIIEKDGYIEFQREHHTFNPGHKFYTLLKQGLEENGIDVEVFSFVNLAHKAYIGRDTHYHYVQVDSRKDRKKGALKLAKSAAGIIKNDDIVIADGESYWSMIAALNCRKITKRPIVEVITDFSHLVYSTCSNEWKQDNIIWRFLKQIYQYYKLIAVKKANAFVLLTESMTDVVGKKKPYAVIEGFSQTSVEVNKSTESELRQKKHIYYFGSLNGQSGIKRLVDCCMSLKEKDFVLHIYGDGEAKQYIIEAQKRDDRIIYGGIVSLDDVSKMEQQADILINPRPTDGAYNRYSFPSKTLEYMSSGTATVTTRLECIPKEYNEHLYFLDDSSEENMKKSLEEILNISKDELRKKGLRAKQYVLTEKSPQKQAKKILHLMESLI